MKSRKHTYELKAAMVTNGYNSAAIDATDDSKDLPKEQMTATAGKRAGAGRRRRTWQATS